VEFWGADRQGRHGGEDLREAEETRELAAFLAGLKQRSGLSYQELGQRVFISSSTLHRYCTGKAVPSDYGLVVQFAKECGAEPEELNRLLRHWRTATAQGERRDPPVVTDAPPATTGSSAAPAFRPTTRRLVLTVVLALVVLGTAVASAPRREKATIVSIPAGAASWARTPAPVDPALFGVTMNSSSGAMPSFQVGALRLWDSETRWAQVEPFPGEFDWSTLDRLLDAARPQGLPTLFVFGGTPAWAAPHARKAAYPDGSRAAPPDDLGDWDTYIRALVRHAGDRIDAYELWVMANHPHHYNGRVETLVEMTRRASRIIRAGDPDAVVVCPSVTELWKRTSHNYLLRFAALGGYQYCDAAGIKLYQRQVSDPPETMLEAVAGVEKTFQRAGYHLPLWNTGTTQTLQLNEPLEDDRAADYAVRFYLTGLYGQKRGIERMYFYAWGNGSIPLVLQAEGQAPRKAALYVARLQQWLVHAEIRSCGHGREISLPENVWQCEFLIPDERGVRRPARIRWTHTGTADTPAGPGAHRVRHLDGTAHEVDALDAVHITERPLLIEYG